MKRDNCRFVMLQRMNSLSRTLFRAAASLALALPLATIAAEPLYPDVAKAKPDLEAALKEASAAKKRVIVDFGGNWCTDCKILDINLKKPENAEVLKKHYVLVHVNVGDKGITDNFEMAERYAIPLKKGVPALAVLEADGKRRLRAEERRVRIDAADGPEVGQRLPAAMGALSSERSVRSSDSSSACKRVDLGGLDQVVVEARRPSRGARSSSCPQPVSATIVAPCPGNSARSVRATS